MPTRRIFELTLVVALLARPTFGLIHLWSVKTLQSQPAGTILHGAAQIGVVLT